MIVRFDKSFEKSLNKLKDVQLLQKIERLILKLENSNDLTEISSVKKLAGHKTYYRVRIGDFRVGLEKELDGVRLIIVAHRKEIYGLFS
jgi:mRNA interferase RelE/StbE